MSETVPGHCSRCETETLRALRVGRLPACPCSSCGGVGLEPSSVGPVAVLASSGVGHADLSDLVLWGPEPVRAARSILGSAMYLIARRPA